MGHNPISCKSTKHATVSLSSTDVENRNVWQVVGELVWVERLLDELSVQCSLSIQVFCDSQAIDHIAKNPCLMKAHNI